jgi:hypothetical protein
MSSSVPEKLSILSKGHFGTTQFCSNVEQATLYRYRDEPTTHQLKRKLAMAHPINTTIEEHRSTVCSILPARSGTGRSPDLLHLANEATNIVQPVELMPRSSAHAGCQGAIARHWLEPDQNHRSGNYPIVCGQKADVQTLPAPPREVSLGRCDTSTDSQ